MNRGIQLLVLFSVLFTLSNCKKAKQDILYSKNYIDEIKQTRKEIAVFMASNFVPGTGIAISKNGELIYSEGLGLASKDLNVKVTRNSKFRIGTLSELFTSAMYFKMIEEGKLNADSTVQHYYPEFPRKEHDIYLKHLAQHVSGIREPNSKEKSSRGLHVTLEKGIEIFKDDPLIFPTGNYQKPSTFNYNLLGLIMEKVEKNMYHKMLQSYIVDTLHLENTLVDNPLSTIENRSNFFDHNIISQVVRASSTDLRHRVPSEGILSSPEDLIKLGNALLSSDYFSKETKQNIFTPYMLPNGEKSSSANGWVVLQDKNGNMVYGKDGSVIGGSASLLIYPKDELVIAFATNLTGATADFPIFKIAHLFLPEMQDKE